MIDYAALKAWVFDDIVQQYSTDDSVRYALALGLGSNPIDPQQLRFLSDDADGMPLALPTMAVVLGYPGSWMRDPTTGIDFSKIVHGEEGVVWHAPIPAAGTVRAKHRITRIVDKGPGRGAVVTYDKELFEAHTGTLLATVTHSTFARGNGGFATETHPGDTAASPSQPVPTAAPTQVIEVATLPQQALLYRLCGDRNPLHSDPQTARAAGFDRPILHGLCTWGIVGHVLLGACADSDPARLRRLFARFSAPVFPGETLRVELHEDSNEVRFRVLSVGSDRVVLDHGHAVFSR